MAHLSALSWALMVSGNQMPNQRIPSLPFPPSACLCLGGGTVFTASKDGSCCCSFLFLPLLLPTQPTAAGKVGQECLGQSSEVPALLSSGAVLLSPGFCQGPVMLP